MPRSQQQSPIKIMDYQLRRDLYGQHHAELSIGVEAFGHWLNDELQSNHPLMTTLLQQIEQLQQKQTWEYQHSGREFSLTLTQEEVTVRAMLLEDEEDIAPDELEHYDQESQASCGLDDFRQLLEAWQAFTTR